MVSFSQLDSALEATADLERCARFLDLEDWIVTRLRQCEQEITLSTALHTHPLAVLWVRHSSALGPAAISLQLARDATAASERARAMQSTWISALYGLHYGGGAATILLDPKDYSENEIRAAFQSIRSAIAEVAGRGQIYPFNLNPIETQWLTGHDDPPGRKTEELAFGLLELIRCSTGKLRDLRIAIQGFDAIAKSLTSLLHRAGARIVAVADESGGLRDPLGLDPAALASHVHSAGMLLGYPNAEAVVNANVLESECDVVILAAAPNQVTSQNCHRVRARILVEAVPQAINPEVKSELNSAGKLILSGLICGGLRPLLYCTAPERARLAAPVRPFLRRSIRHMWSQLQAASARWQLPSHTAAEMLAIQRVADAIRVNGN